ncbi:MAG: serine/threonine protein kinase, partial [Anaerolineales bacterium]
MLKGRYSLENKLGEGGMAEIYRARHEKLGTDVAIKFIKEIIDTDEFRARFEREARAAAQLSHPNILNVFDYDQADDGRFFMVMDLLDGQDLGAYLNSRETPASLAEIVHIMRGALEALRYAHARGIIHRDIKPSNIFITTDKRVVMMDFGIAKIAGEANLTKTGQLLGTPRYMAPEIIDNGEVDQRIDIYAMGVVLYQLFTNEFPFKGNTTMEVLAQHITGDIPDPRQTRPELPPAATMMVMRAMAKPPAERYPDADAFLQDLDLLAADLTPSHSQQIEALLPELRARASQSAATGSMVSALGGATPTNLAEPTLVIHPQRTPLWMRAAIALLVLGMLGLGAFIFSEEVIEDDPGPEPAVVANENATTDEAANRPLPTEVAAEPGDRDEQPGRLSERLDLPPAARADEYLILVADVQRQITGSDVQARIVDYLRASNMATHLGDRLRVVPLPEPIRTDRGAEDVLQATNAAAVVYTTRSGTDLVVHILGPQVSGPDTLDDYAFIVPESPATGEILLNDVPPTVTAYTMTLLIERMLRNADLSEVLNSLTDMADTYQDLNPPRVVFRAQPDEHVLESYFDLGQRAFDGADENLSRALERAPDDLNLLFMRWMVNTNFLARATRAQADIEAIAELDTPQSLIDHMRAQTAIFVTGDLEAVLALSEDLRLPQDEEPDDYFYYLFSYRMLALGMTGQFAQFLDEYDKVPPERIATETGLPISDIVLALAYEVNGDTDAAAQSRTIILTDRNLEIFLESFQREGANTDSLQSFSLDLLFIGTYIYEITDNMLASIGYSIGLAREPRDYLFNWRRAIL